MKKLLILFFSIQLVLSAYSQQWFSSPAPNQRDINCVKIFNHDTIITAGGWHIVSSFQTILTPALIKTTLSGLGLWNVVGTTDTNEHWIKSMDFMDFKNGIAVGWGGKIISTDDEGENWGPITSPVLRDFNKLFLIDSLNMIIVGGQLADSIHTAMQTILKSSNGGQTWNIVRDEPGTWLKAVYFINSTTGYAVGDSGTILKSINGGDTWNPVASPIQRDFNSIWFADANNGVIVGGNLSNDSIRTILRTTNGGNTWTVNKDELGGWLTDVHFFNADTGYIVGDRATLLKTTDAGQTWVQQTIPGAAGDEYFNAVRFYSRDFGFVAGKWGVQYIYNNDVAPEAYTIGVDIDSANVTFNGLVNSHGYASVYTYILSADNFTTPHIEIPYPGNVRSNVLAPAPYSIPFSWLTPNTTYHYLIKAWTLGGTVYGDTLSFFIGNSNSELITAPATNIMDSSVTLNGSVKGFYAPINLFFEYGLTPALGSQIAATPSLVNDTLQHDVTANLNSLQLGTLYYFRLRGEIGSGNYYGDIYSFFIGPVFDILQTLAPTEITDTSATLNGLIAGFAVPVTLSFELGFSAQSFSEQIFSNPSIVIDSATTFVNGNVISLLPANLYYYRVKAETSLGTYYSTPLFFYTGWSHTNLQTLTATEVTTSSAVLQGRAKLTLPANLSFQYGTTVLMENEVQSSPGTVNDTSDHYVSAALSGLQNNTLYYYRIKAETNSGATSVGEIKQLYVGLSSVPNWDFQDWSYDTTALLYHWLILTDHFERVPGHSGNYALKVYNQNIVTLGIPKPENNALSLYGGIPFNFRPDSVVAWFNNAFAANNMGGMIVSLTNNGMVIAQQFCIVGGNTGGAFERMAFKIDYTSPLIPDSLAIAFLIGSNDTMTIDDISFSPSGPPVVNGDFETWYEYPHHSIQDWEYPKFPVFDSVPGSDFPPVSQTYFRFPSDYAPEIANVNVNVYGRQFVFDGNISTSLGILGPPNPSFSVHKKHLSLNGYFQFFPANGDTSVIEIFMFKNGQFIGQGGFYCSDTVSRFQGFEVPIIYDQQLNLIPDSAIITIASSKGIARGLSRLIIDKLTFDGWVDTSESILGISQISQANFIIFPNPTSSSITIQLESAVDGWLEIYDIKGKLMFSDKFTGNKLEVNAEDFSKGIYMVSIMQEGKRLVNKFMVIQ